MELRKNNPSPNSVNTDKFKVHVSSIEREEWLFVGTIFKVPPIYVYKFINFDMELIKFYI